MDGDNTQEYYPHPQPPSSYQSPNDQDIQSVPQIPHAQMPPMDAYAPHPAATNQQQQYAAYMQQRSAYYAQQQYMAQQRQYAAYYQSVMRQRQQQQYAHYYQHVARQYGYQQMTPTHNMNHNHIDKPSSPDRSSRGSIMLSSEEQPALIAAPPDHNKYKRRRRRKRKKPESDDEENDNDDYSWNQEDDGYDKHTLINDYEDLPDIDTEFDEWLYFTKKLWKRQKQYKADGIYHRQQSQTNSNKKEHNNNNNHNDKRDVLDLTESLSISDDSSQSPSDTLQLKSTFLRDRARMNQKHKNVLENRRVINIMISMGLAPPWGEMSKYTKWKKCHQWNT